MKCSVAVLQLETIDEEPRYQSVEADVVVVAGEKTRSLRNKMGRVHVS